MMDNFFGRNFETIITIIGVVAIIGFISLFVNNVEIEVPYCAKEKHCFRYSGINIFTKEAYELEVSCKKNYDFYRMISINNNTCFNEMSTKEFE